MGFPTTSLPALQGATPLSVWLDDPAAPTPQPALLFDITCDLLVVGGGYAGLWSALHAKRRDPSLDVVLVESQTVGWAASGRNGGFVSSSLTHGIGNGHSRWPGEMPLLEKLGMANLNDMEDEVAGYGIDCNFERTGKLNLATKPHQLAELEAGAALASHYGRDLQILSARETRDRVDSPTYLGASYDTSGSALVNPAKLAWGLKQAALDAGVRIYEGTPVEGLRNSADVVAASTPFGTVRAKRVILATNAFPSPLTRTRLMTVPVWDYVITTNPLTPEQKSAIGWAGREGLTDAGNEFHYYRLTEDDRIVYGGYDAIYNFGSKIDSHLDQRPQTFEKLAGHLVATFPQLAGIGFSHTWGGAIDTNTRFFASYGTAMGGKVGYAVGYTGLGVAATRFAADVVLDLLDGAPTERTSLSMVKQKAFAWPPEPARYIGITLTKNALARSDENEGRRGPWLKVLDRFGVGFDS